MLQTKIYTSKMLPSHSSTAVPPKEVAERHWSDAAWEVVYLCSAAGAIFVARSRRRKPSGSRGGKSVEVTFSTKRNVRHSFNSFRLLFFFFLKRCRGPKNWI